MSFTRDRSRIPVGAQTVGIEGDEAGSHTDLGYLVEGSMKIKATPQIIRDEIGFTRVIGYLIEYQFELLQGDYTMLSDIETYLAGQGDKTYNILLDSTQVLADVPFNIEFDRTYSWDVPRTIKASGAVKCKNISDVWLSDGA